ncbi:hypothetical protein WN51_02615 [Melipona quadrifasciata]|uniref:Uncharacterized protein n=1 Tax=Melipona quadrifasciata TaxID=166423 RepID=A0A0M8ZVT4_9HYME|nr:hypothetical protein WN51_02615 [Melipona quadrifasciata]
MAFKSLDLTKKHPLRDGKTSLKEKLYKETKKTDFFPWYRQSLVSLLVQLCFSPHRLTRPKSFDTTSLIDPAIDTCFVNPTACLDVARHPQQILNVISNYITVGNLEYKEKISSNTERDLAERNFRAEFVHTNLDSGWCRERGGWYGTGVLPGLFTGNQREKQEQPGSKGIKLAELFARLKTSIGLDRAEKKLLLTYK